jgi:uncharacterized membrane protein SirB2
MTLFGIFDWLEQTAVGAVIRDSTWLFPVVESAHLLGLAMLGGAILVVDLRLLGFGLREMPTAYVLEQSRPFLLGAITLMFATGIPLFLSEAVKCYWSDAFWLKMAALCVALFFTFAVRNRVVRARSDIEDWKARAIGSGSLAVWLTVAVAGRWIGFS